MCDADDQHDYVVSNTGRESAPWSVPQELVNQGFVLVNAVVRIDISVAERQVYKSLPKAIILIPRGL